MGSKVGWARAQALRSVRFIASHRALSAAAAGVFVFTTVFSAVTLGNAPQAQAAGGWLSGASGKAIEDGSFGNWRGAKLTIAATWDDNAGASAAMSTFCGSFRNWSESLDIAPGGVFAGQSWAQAASGGLDAQWRNSIKKMYDCWGPKKTVFLRPFHELNGNWYPWKVGTGDVANFKTAWIRYYNIVKTELKDKGKDVRLELCVNNDTVNGVGIGQMWPGDQYVDVVGVDYYDGYPPIQNDSAWNNITSNPWKSQPNDPKFPEAYKQFAKAHGKPLTFPEWGIRKDLGGDNAFFIRKMYEFFAANAGTGPGQVMAEIFYNDDYLGDNFILYPDNKGKPNAAAMYKSLKWPTDGTAGSGGTGGGSTPTPVAVTPKPTTPTPTPGSGGCSSLKNAKADINGDCKVNITDLSILLASWAP